MATVNKGPNWWELGRDEDGHRTYRITFRVRSDTGPGADMDGPAVVLATDGLPRPGDSWDFFGDADPAAVCTHEADVQPAERKEPYTYFDATYTFTSKPKNFCQGGTRDDPTSYPPEIDIKTRKVRQEASEDAYGWPLLSSSHEPLHGSAVEKERAITVVTIKRNVPDAAFDLPLYDRLRGCTNAVEMWGMRPGTVLFSDFGAAKKYGAQCQVFWESTFELEVDKEGWAKEAADEGLKALDGRYVRQADGTYVYTLRAGADANDPRDFVQYQDPRGENARVRLNGAGLPAGVIVGRTGLFIAVAPGAGHALGDAGYWLAVRGGYDTDLYRESGSLSVYAYVVGAKYPAGTLALSGDLLTAYVATQDEPPDEPGTAGWLAVGDPVLPVQGLYSSVTAYAVGDVIDGSREETTQGYVPVILHTPVDLLTFLGDVIPADLNLAD